MTIISRWHQRQYPIYDLHLHTFTHPQVLRYSFCTHSQQRKTNFSVIPIDSLFSQVLSWMFIHSVWSFCYRQTSDLDRCSQSDNRCLDLLLGLSAYRITAVLLDFALFSKDTETLRRRTPPQRLCQTSDSLGILPELQAKANHGCSQQDRRVWQIDIKTVGIHSINPYCAKTQ